MLGVALALAAGLPATAQEAAVNPFLGTLDANADLFFQLVDRFDAVQGQIQDVNQRLLQLQATVETQTGQFEQIAALNEALGLQGGGDSPILAAIADLQQQEQQEARFVALMQRANFVMCANDRALFRDETGRPFTVTMDEAAENETFRLLGRCD